MTDPELRIGLALSGGGFRAAFFHVGVLGRLAEFRLLRSVRMLSCVSGGSIAGALYYLTLRARVAETTGELTDEDYVDCVQRTRSVLLEGGAANIRARVFWNPAKNLSMFLSPRYSRTDRAGDVFDALVCRRIVPTGPRYGFLRQQVELGSLHPAHARLPTIVLNATTLNNGHNWRFTTDGMGEQFVPNAMRDDVDRNDRLAWARWEEIPPEQKDFPLGLAIAASAAFPILFRPLPITGLYPGFRVDLMDGGAQDNLGLQALFDRAEQFDVLVVSDGSGQLKDEQRASRGIPKVIKRAGDVARDRIREEQLLRASERQMAATGRQPAVVLVHLRDGLVPRTFEPLSAPAPPKPDPTQVTSLGIELGIQELLARVRTDLDEFAPLEAHALIADGYRIAEQRLVGLTPGAPLPGAGVGNWAAPSVVTQLSTSSPGTRSRLAASSALIGKPWRPSGLLLLVYGFALELLVGFATLVWPHLPEHGWPALGLSLSVVALPALVTRAGYAVLSRWFTVLVGRPFRPLLWALTLLVYIGLFALVGVLAPHLADWIGEDWSRTTMLLAALGLSLLPPFAPVAVAGLLLVEGRCWRRLAGLPHA